MHIEDLIPDLVRVASEDRVPRIRGLSLLALSFFNRRDAIESVQHAKVGDLHPKVQQFIHWIEERCRET